MNTKQIIMTLLTVILTCLVSFTLGVKKGSDAILKNFKSLSPNIVITNKLQAEIKACELKWHTECGLSLTKSTEGIIYYEISTKPMIDKSVYLYGVKHGQNVSNVWR